MALKLTMTCGLYDRSQPLIDGRVRTRDIDLEIHVNSSDRSRQGQAREGKFDIAEFFWVAMSMFHAWEEAKKECYGWLEWQLETNRRDDGKEFIHGKTLFGFP
jgi:hypothetical protein